MAVLRSLTVLGVETFEAYIEVLRQNPLASPPVELLTSDEPSTSVAGAHEVTERLFANKLEMAAYVSTAFPEAVRQSSVAARGVWAWLSLFWFDQLVPPDPKTGERYPNKTWYYVPSLSHFSEYRHLLSGPYRTYRSYGDSGRLLLLHQLSVWSDVEEQLAGRRDFLRLPGALAAADQLYFDAKKGKPKSGITNRNKPGNIRRLRTVLEQFARTYDIYSMSGSQVVSLLPQEFDPYR